MGALDRVLQMKKEGISEGEIIAKLKTEGVSPMEINDALNQSKIKEAVSNPNPTEGMVPSIMGTSEGEAQVQQAQLPLAQDIYNPAPQEQDGPQAYNPQPPMQSYPMDTQEEYYEEGYSPDQYTGYESTSDTMIEIAEQVFSEKIKLMEKKLHEMTEFRTIYSTRIDDINERLKRMEKYFDKMQMTIIDKVGTYGKELSSIQKEMEMIEDSFSKIHKK